MSHSVRHGDSQEDTGSYFALQNFGSSADPLREPSAEQESPGLPETSTESDPKQRGKKNDVLQAGTYKFTSFLNTWWAFELLSCVVSVITLIAIVLVLRMYDDKTLLEWPLELTLNAVLSILSILIRSSLALPLAQATSQLKWLWFRKERTLADLQTFDEASRGQSGAVKLLFTTKGSHLASLGSLVTLATIALGPIIQQLVSYDTRPVPTLLTGLAVPRSETWTVNTTESGGMTESTISRGFYYSGNDSMPFSTPPSCPTTECTWDVFNSLAVTHKCADVTDITKKECWRETSRPHLYCNFTVSDIEVLDCKPFNGGCSTGTFYTVDEDEEMSELSTLVTESTIGLLTFAAATYTEEVEEYPELLDWMTLQCQIYLSVNKYEPNTKDGVYSEQILASSIDGRPMSQGWIEMYQGTGTERFAMEYLEPDAATIGNDTKNRFGMTGRTKMTLLQAFENLFGIRPTSWASAAYQNPDQVELDAAKVIGQNGSLEDFPTKVERFVKNMALSLSNDVRTTGDGDAVLGNMLIQETYVHVRWWWLFFPGVLQTLTAVYLVATMMQSRRESAPAWKSSSLAVFRFGMVSEADEKLAQARELVEIEETAGRAKSKIE